jgi:hypothetical protein
MTAHRRTKPPDQRRIGPYSLLLRRGTISGRSTEGRFIRAIEAQLRQHVGSSPTFPEQMLIKRLAIVSLRLELFDRKLAAGEPITDHDARVYASLHNSFRLMIRELGLKAAPPPARTLQDIIAEMGEDEDYHDSGNEAA